MKQNKFVLVLMNKFQYMYSTLVNIYKSTAGPT